VLQFLSNHLVCLQNAFKKTYPESRSPKDSCHILCWLEVYILQNNIMPGRELPTSWQECNRPPESPLLSLMSSSRMAGWPLCHIVNSTSDARWERVNTRGGQISTKHQKTLIKPFFATCRLPQYPEFWRCVETGILFGGPHCKRSLKSLDNLLKVPMRNTQLLPRPRKKVAVVLNIFFWGVDMFFIFWCALSPPPPPS
jgi:hypothetical protein